MKKIITIVVIVMILAVVLVQEAVPHFLPALFTSLARPFWRAEFSINSGSLRSSQELLLENESLKRLLTDAEVRLETIQSVITENEQLKSLLGRGVASDTIGFKAGSGADNPGAGASSSSAIVATSSAPFDSAKFFAVPKDLILAAVLVRPPFAPYDELVIDGGTDLGFSAGDKVYAAGRVLIGSISEALGQTSKVALYSSPGKAEQVLIGSSNAAATASGRGGGQYYAELPRSAAIFPGDFVIAPSLGDAPFGVVKAVLSDPARAFQTVIFTPPVNVFQERWVLVEKSKI